MSVGGIIFDIMPVCGSYNYCYYNTFWGGGWVVVVTRVVSLEWVVGGWVGKRAMF